MELQYQSERARETDGQTTEANLLTQPMSKVGADESEYAVWLGFLFFLPSPLRFFTVQDSLAKAGGSRLRFFRNIGSFMT